MNYIPDPNLIACFGIIAFVLIIDAIRRGRK